MERANRTFYRLLDAPLRRQLWEQYGIYTQFDVLAQAGGAPGHGSSAYGHDYALQVMLMQDELEMAGRGLALLGPASGKYMALALHYSRLFCLEHGGELVDPYVQGVEVVSPH